MFRTIPDEVLVKYNARVQQTLREHVTLNRSVSAPWRRLKQELESLYSETEHFTVNRSTFEESIFYRVHLEYINALRDASLYSVWILVVTYGLVIGFGSMNTGALNFALLSWRASLRAPAPLAFWDGGQRRGEGGAALARKSHAGRRLSAERAPRPRRRPAWPVASSVLRRLGMATS